MNDTTLEVGQGASTFLGFIGMPMAITSAARLRSLAHMLRLHETVATTQTV